jgi:hypothetical protein
MMLGPSKNRPRRQCLVHQLLLCFIILALAQAFSFQRRPAPVETPLVEEPSDKSQLSRRQILDVTLATLGFGTTFYATQEFQPTDYGLWGILPVGPYKRKKTIFETIVPDSVWTLDQKFGILNVQGEFVLPFFSMYLYNI